MNINCRSKITHLENGQVQIDFDTETLKDIQTILEQVHTLFKKPFTEQRQFVLIDSIFNFFFSYDDDIGRLEDLLSYIVEFLEYFADMLERSEQNE